MRFFVWPTQIFVHKWFEFLFRDIDFCETPQPHCVFVHLMNKKVVRWFWISLLRYFLTLCFVTRMRFLFVDFLMSRCQVKVVQRNEYRTKNRSTILQKGGKERVNVLTQLLRMNQIIIIIITCLFINSTSSCHFRSIWQWSLSAV